MGPWSLFLIASGGVCLAAGLPHLMVGLRRRDRREHLCFGLAVLAVSTYCFISTRAYHVTAIDEYSRLLRLDSALGAVVVASMTWFVALFSDIQRRWLVWLQTGLCALWFLATALLPASIRFERVTELEEITMPWGEVLMMGTGPVNSWRFLTDISAVIAALVVIQGCTALAMRGERRRAWVLAMTFGLHWVVSSVYGLFVDVGWVSFPYLGTIVFLGAIVVMSMVLASDVIKARELADEVRAKDVRWGELLEEIPLLVVIFSGDGTIQWANRFACSALGYALDEVVGRSLLDFTPSWGRAKAIGAIERASQGVPDPAFENGAITASGHEICIVWSGVVIRDAEGEIEGLMGIGADVTEQRTTQAQRDRAIADLESLRRQLEEENVYLRDEIRSVQGFSGMVGESDALKKVLVDIRKVAPTNATVLIQGETGVGKELAARAVHDASPRAEAPFVAVNCAALPANLVESELFGHERGAFTDARQRRRGRFELADGGTLFLDEITELPLDLQPKLLRVVQQGEFQRVGGSVTHRVDVRMIAASNRDLRAEVKAGRFREDLFYRLNVFPITVPPLRDRVEDIPLLVGHFVPAIAARIGREVDEIPASVMRELVNYTWPGNVRELLNILERSVLTSPDSVLVLPETLHGSDDPVPVDHSGPLLTLEQHEREYVAQILRVTKGQVAGPGGAAEILGVNPSTLRSRLKKLGLSARR